MFLRRVLIRLLLLAVCFHTVVGLPAHEASHIQQRIARAAALVLADGGSPRVPGPGPSATALGAPAVFLDADARVGLLEAIEDGTVEGTAAGAGAGGSAIDTLCAWCAAFGQIASALASPPPAPTAAADAPGPAFPRSDAVFVPRPERWRFAARDPPGARVDRSAPPPSSPSSSS